MAENNKKANNTRAPDEIRPSSRPTRQCICLGNVQRIIDTPGFRTLLRSSTELDGAAKSQARQGDAKTVNRSAFERTDSSRGGATLWRRLARDRRCSVRREKLNPVAFAVLFGICASSLRPLRRRTTACPTVRDGAIRSAPAGPERPLLRLTEKAALRPPWVETGSSISRRVMAIGRYRLDNPSACLQRRRTSEFFGWRKRRRMKRGFSPQVIRLIKPSMAIA